MNKKINQKIFISGGGNANESFIIDKAFIQSLIEKKILYIPIALDRDVIGYETCYDWIIKTLSKHSNDFVDITMWVDLKNKTLQDLIMFNAVYIGGGNTFNLYKNICENNFNKFVPQFLKNVGVVYGGSAGAIILGKSILTAKLADTNLVNWLQMEGMNLVNGYSIWCHYDYGKEHDKHINLLMTEGVEKIIALSNQTGIIVEDSQIQVAGYVPAAVFKNNYKSLIQPGRFIL